MISIFIQPPAFGKHPMSPIAEPALAGATR
jgi:hypothetical protein